MHPDRVARFGEVGRVPAQRGLVWCRHGRGTASTTSSRATSRSASRRNTDREEGAVYDRQTRSLSKKVIYIYIYISSEDDYNGTIQASPAAAPDRERGVGLQYATQ